MLVAGLPTHIYMNTAFFHQFGKFILIGCMNTLVDFAVLNALIYSFGLVHDDPRYVYFKITSAIFASLNSFICNKHWVFKQAHTSTKKVGREIGEFASVTVFSLLINAAVASFVFGSMHVAATEIGERALANIGALAGTIVVLVFNFIAYKFIVFRRRPQP